MLHRNTAAAAVRLPCTHVTGQQMANLMYVQEMVKSMVHYTVLYVYTHAPRICQRRRDELRVCTYLLHFPRPFFPFGFVGRYGAVYTVPLFGINFTFLVGPEAQAPFFKLNVRSILHSTYCSSIPFTYICM